MKKFSYFLPIILSFFISCSPLSSSRPPHKEQAGLERVIGDISSQESKLINIALNLANKRYNLSSKITLVESEKKEDVAGEAFFRLDNERFKEEYGENLYNSLKGKNVIVLRDFSFFKADNQKLWNSLYLKNPSPEILYQRAILHEVGHIVYSQLNKEDLSKKLFEIDAEKNIGHGENSKTHLAHPSFYSFFFSGFKEARGTELEEINARETFAEIFALRVLGYLDNVQDNLLIRKISLIEDALKKD